MSDATESDPTASSASESDAQKLDAFHSPSPQQPVPEATVAPASDQPAEQPAAVTAEAAAARKELLRLAMKAFRKRLKLTILDDESRLGRGPMSGGSKSSVIAITPPNQFPRDVWEELALQGKLKRAGKGVYELTE